MKNTIRIEVDKRKAKSSYENLLKSRYEQFKNRYVPICERANENPLDNFHKGLQ